MYLLVAYDVVSDRRRARLAKRLVDFLPRVQKSVFEGEVPDHRFRELERVIQDGIDPETDSVRIYHLCRRCWGSVLEMGRGSLPVDSEDDVIT